MSNIDVDMTSSSTTTVSRPEGKSLLMSLPLEMRHKIFGFASQRPHGPYLILKEYLEKKDPDIGPPALPAPPAMINGEDEEGEEDEDEDEGETEDGDIEGEAVDGEGEAADAGEGEHEDQDEQAEESNAEEDSAMEEASEVSHTTTTAAMSMSAANAQGDEQVEPEVETIDVDSHETGNNENEEGDNESGSEEDEDEDDGNFAANPPNPPAPAVVHSLGNTVATGPVPTNATVAPPQASRPPHPAPRYFGRNTKYRHMLPTIQLSSPPPPLGLLQSCKQLYNEALSYHLATCVLEIDVTREFLHQSFFLETLSQFIDHAFSPTEQIRKVSLVFSWDSEWLTSKLTGSPAELCDDFAFTWFLQERVAKAIDLLKAAPELRKLTIDWHDTERTDKSENLMNETIMPFLSLAGKTWTDSVTNESGYIDVTATEHFSEPDTVHARSSVLGRRRNEFDIILAHQMQFR
jgi:hypothetical protein